MTDEFWDFLQILVSSNKIVIDRRKGSTHHRITGKNYPVDYGYLDGTTSIDLKGGDIWIGSLGEQRIVGVLCSVDL